MASDENIYGIEHLLGSANLPRNSSPRLRGTVRRADPDGGSSVPYFSGLNTKTLTVNVTPVGDLVLTFTADGYQDAIKPSLVQLPRYSASGPRITQALLVMPERWRRHQRGGFRTRTIRTAPPFYRGMRI
jgi:hypothetical protein